jgi:hypothetical protein
MLILLLNFIAIFSFVKAVKKNLRCIIEGEKSILLTIE